MYHAPCDTKCVLARALVVVQRTVLGANERWFFNKYSDYYHVGDFMLLAKNHNARQSTSSQASIKYLVLYIGPSSLCLLLLRVDSSVMYQRLIPSCVRRHFNEPLARFRNVLLEHVSDEKKKTRSTHILAELWTNCCCVSVPVPVYS